MHQRFLPFIAATDASTVYGHGAAVAPVPEHVAREVSLHCHKQGAHILFEDHPGRQRCERIGKPVLAQFRYADFELIFSIRVHHPNHVNLEEARALLRFARWIL